MASSHSHKERVAQNKQFSVYCEAGQPPYYNWAVVAQFYAAVHIVEAVLSGKWSLHSGNHRERNINLNQHEDVFSVKMRADYKSLYALSRTARYEIVEFGADHSEKAKGYVLSIEKELGTYVS